LSGYIAGNRSVYRFYSSSEKKNEPRMLCLLPPVAPPETFERLGHLKLLHPQTVELDWMLVQYERNFQTDNNQPCKDNTAEVEMKIPRGFSEDMKLATLLGCWRFLKPSSKQGALVTLQFYPRSEEDRDVFFGSSPFSSTMEDFLNLQRRLFFKDHPKGTVNALNLSPILTQANFTQKNLPFGAFLFNNNDVEPEKRVVFYDQKKIQLPRMSLFVQTPGGFWELSYFSDHLENETFAELVKNLKFELKVDPKSSQTTRSIIQNQIAEAPKLSTDAKSDVLLNDLTSTKKASPTKKNTPSPLFTDTDEGNNNNNTSRN